jgi:hypothetical protein
LRQSPSSADCLYWSGEMASNLGRCAESEDYARRLIISAPSSPGGYELLAGALYWSHGTEEARAALEQRWQRVPESERAAVVLADEFVLAALKSDWPAAENFVQQWAVAVKSAGQDLSSGRPILRQIELLMELDRGREARELADRYVHLSRAWSADIVQDFFIDVLRLKYRAGGMTRDEWRRERDQWLESKKRSYWSGFADMRWLSAYAGIDEPDEESRAHFPEEKPIVSILAVEPDVLDDIGKSLLAWGRTDEAIESFALGARSCTIEFPLASMRAHFHLGQAYEAKGDVSSACTEYSALSARFRGTRTTALARDRVKVLGCNRADASLN